MDEATALPKKDENANAPLVNYFNAIHNGSPLLCFTLYVPVGYGYLGSQIVPNVEETEDPAKIFTATFNNRLHNQTATWAF